MSNEEFERRVRRDGGGRFADKPVEEAHRGTRALETPRRRDIVRVDHELVRGRHVTGTSVGYSAKGRKLYDATWSGVYVGVENPTPDDPFVDENGETHPGDTIHLFRDGEVNGIPQAYFGFPVDQFEGQPEPVTAVGRDGMFGSCSDPEVCKEHVAHGDAEIKKLLESIEERKAAKRNPAMDSRGTEAVTS